MSDELLDCCCCCRNWQSVAPGSKPGANWNSETSKEVPKPLSNLFRGLPISSLAGCFEHPAAQPCTIRDNYHTSILDQMFLIVNWNTGRIGSENPNHG
jgi:hypothetical protein